MTETDLLARTALVALLMDIRPIPPGVALDMVQDSCNTRDEALAAIRVAFADRLGEEMPESPADGPLTPNHVTALAAVSNLRHGSDYLANVCVRELRTRTYRSHVRAENPGEADLWAAWLRWCSYAERYLLICRDLTAAANLTTGAV